MNKVLKKSDYYLKWQKHFFVSSYWTLMGFECVTFLFAFGLAFLKTLRLFKIFALLRLKDLYRRFSFVPSQYRVDRGVREQLMLLVGNMPTTDGWWLLLETCRSSYLDQCKQSSFLCFSFVAACVLCFVAICMLFLPIRQLTEAFIPALCSIFLLIFLSEHECVACCNFRLQKIP